MRRGDFARAWEISDTVLQARAGIACWHWPRHQQFVWRGASLAGQRVLIRCYHGLGDTVQFIRYAPLVQSVAREVLVWAQPALLPVLRTAPGIDRLLPLHDGTPEAGYDVDVESMELPHVFRSTLADLPAAIPYLHAAPAPLARRAGERHVGVVWSAGEWDDRRSIPFSTLAPLFAIPRIRWHALQRGPALADWPERLGPVSESDSIVETAALMRALDLVLTIDSFPAHLAGALGVPVWTLLHHDADWRWLSDRTDSPWYPTMRLFRQTRAGDWASVVTQALHHLTTSEAPGSPIADTATRRMASAPASVILP